MSTTQDPAAVIQAFDAACNAGDLDQIMAFFTEDAVVKQLPAPPDGGVYRGKQQIRAWLEPQLAGFHVESRGRRTDGETVRWNARVIFDLLRRMGHNQPVEAQDEAVVRAGKIALFTVTNNDQAAGPVGATSSSRTASTAGPVVQIHELVGTTRAQYEEAIRELGLFGPPPGTYLHASGPTDNGWRIVEVWESEEAAGAFYGSERFQQVMQHVGMPAPGITSYPIEAVKK